MVSGNSITLGPLMVPSWVLKKAIEKPRVYECTYTLWPYACMENPSNLSTLEFCVPGAFFLNVCTVCENVLS